MIVVVGVPRWSRAAPGSDASSEAGSPSGLAAGVALAAARAGARVQLVGRIGDDRAGDALVLALATGGVGHVAVLRDAARATPSGGPDGTEDVGEAGGGASDDRVSGGGPELDAADVDLGFRYLTDFSVVVIAHPVVPDVLVVAADAARYQSAHLIVLTDGEATLPDLPEASTILAIPDSGDESAVAALVGGYAAALDRGDDPASAFGGLAAASGWERAPVDEETVAG